MSFLVNAELVYEVPQRSTLLLCIHAESSEDQILRDEIFTTTVGASCEFLSTGLVPTRYVRVDTHDLTNLRLTYSVEVETSPESQKIHGVQDVPITETSPEALPYLFPSRYCQSDQLMPDAQSLFGGIANPLEQAQAIADWIFENVSYQPGTSDSSTSAVDTFRTRSGVCRDFAHLAIAFCRALSIPARYFSGYACDMNPQDFHACFEVSVGNDWYVFDPTRLSRRDGLVRIATGWDASNTAVATIFGSVNLVRSVVDCRKPNDEAPLTGSLEGEAVKLES